MLFLERVIITLGGGGGGKGESVIGREGLCELPDSVEDTGNEFVDGNDKVDKGAVVISRTNG